MCEDSGSRDRAVPFQRSAKTQSAEERSTQVLMSPSSESDRQPSVGRRGLWAEVLMAVGADNGSPPGDSTSDASERWSSCLSDPGSVR